MLDEQGNRDVADRLNSHASVDASTFRVVVNGSVEPKGGGSLRLEVTRKGTGDDQRSVIILR